MKTMMLAFLVTIVIAVGADIVLESMGFSAEDRLTGNAVRLDSGSE